MLHKVLFSILYGISNFLRSIWKQQVMHNLGAGGINKAYYGRFGIMKNWIIGWCDSRALIGLAIMVYEPLYRAFKIGQLYASTQEWKANRKSVVLTNKVGKPDSRYFMGVFNKTIIPLALVGYEMISANEALRASLLATTTKYPTRTRGLIIK